MNKTYFEAKNTKELCKLLGLPSTEAQKIEIRRNLVLAIVKAIKKNKMTHEEAAEHVGVGRTVITAIANGRLERISTDRLMDIAQNLGLKFALKVA